MILLEPPVAALVEHHLPMPPIGYGLLALALFMGLALVTVAFRSVGTRH